MTILDLVQKYGYVKENIDIKNIDILNEIVKLKKEKNVVLLSHYYQDPLIQDLADFVGDSLELSRKAAETNADIILFAGVRFMAETAKIINPTKKVVLPDLNAGCSLEESCPPEKLEEFKRENPDYYIVTYINSSARVKAISDLIVTSSNAITLINSLPEDLPILFVPDKHLGKYVKEKTKRKILVWDGACVVHEIFDSEKIIQLKKEFPDAKIIAHPECQESVLKIADFIGSTSALLKYISEDQSDIFIVATEPGILYQMEKREPYKTFIPAPSLSLCNCNNCPYMKLNTLEKVYLALKYELPEIILDKEIIEKARIPLIKMLEMSMN